MSNSQVAVPENKSLSVGNREVESEEVEETTLSESHKDLGHTQISEKAATFDSNIKKSISVKQSENVEVSANRKDYPASQSITTNSNTTETTESTLSNLGYNRLGPVKSFEPIQPFTPSVPFECPSSFDCPASVGLVKQAQTALEQRSETGNETIEPESASAEAKEDEKTDPVRIIPVLKIQPPPPPPPSENDPIPYPVASSISEAACEQKFVTPSFEKPQESVFQQESSASHPPNVSMLTFEVDFGVAKPPPHPVESVIKSPSLKFFEKMGYEPVQALAPLDINSLYSSYENQQNTVMTKTQVSEIKEESIKNSLKEIISDLDNYVERNEALKSSVEGNKENIRNGAYSRNGQIEKLNLLAEKEQKEISIVQNINPGEVYEHR
ncbi:hypothetical protein JTB14_018131 [Gonioctena quinquepunctata]|nr:hypothetical protein JTB14_018131 [Gonioctena quinquepunctata]